MKKLFLSCRLIPVLLAGFIFLGDCPVLAVDLPRLSQAKIRLSVSPGESGYGEIIVDNPGPEAMSIRLYLEDWFYAEGADGAKVFSPASSTPRSCASWISFSPVDLRLSPFTRQKVSYSVKVPLEARGGYYAALFFETAGSRIGPEDSQAGVGINLVFRLAVLFYIEAKGTIIRTGEFQNLTLENNLGKLSINMDFLNTGNVDITAGGSFHIMDENGMVYSRGEFNDVYTFSQDKARLTAFLNEPLGRGRYDLVLTLDIGKALKETNMGRLPPLTKEAQIEIGERGELLRLGGLK